MNQVEYIDLNMDATIYAYLEEFQGCREFLNQIKLEILTQLAYNAIQGNSNHQQWLLNVSYRDHDEYMRHIRKLLNACFLVRGRYFEPDILFPVQERELLINALQIAKTRAEGYIFCFGF